MRELYLKKIHSQSDLTDSDKYLVEIMNNIVRGQIVVVSDEWWMIVGDNKVEQRYHILQRLTTSTTTEERDAIFEEIRNIK